MMGISISTPMPDDGNCQVIEHLEARPLRARRGWSAEAKARLVEKTLVPGANVSAIARGVGMAPSQLFGWRRQARVARAAIRNEAVDAGRPMRFERFAAVSCARWWKLSLVKWCCASEAMSSLIISLMS